MAQFDAMAVENFHQENSKSLLPLPVYKTITRGIIIIENHTIQYEKPLHAPTWNGYNRPTPSRGGGTVKE